MTDHDDVLNPQRGQELREEAIAKVRGHVDPGWFCRALSAVRTVARERPTFTTDQVWERLIRDGVGAVTEPRAMGSVMRTAESTGVVKATDTWELSKRPGCHRRPVRVWRSQDPLSGSPEVLKGSVDLKVTSCKG